MWGLSSLNFTAINLNPATFFRRCFLFLFVFYSQVASSGAEWTHLNHTDRLSVELNGHLSSGKGRQANHTHQESLTTLKGASPKRGSHKVRAAFMFILIRIFISWCGQHLNEVEKGTREERKREGRETKLVKSG